MMGRHFQGGRDVGDRCNCPLVHPLYLEDIAVGDRTQTGEIPVTRDMITTFAADYDPQPMHIDEVSARSTLFGELVGSGWQTLAITMRLLVDARLLGSTPIVGAEFRAIRFHAPVRPGDRLRATAEVLATRRSKSRPDRGFMDLSVRTENQCGHSLVTQTWTLVVPTRSERPTG